ncbi:MAG: RNA-guided endonuclease IscB [Methanosarcina sp.]|jgi:5-methylcytosine-specific restriction endonuclease McrA|nr:RNA-guided endonuclease IscB [Methanosarcina sp.]MDD3873035.1 RNA-guided endonuclease IscB [Methanosarcina sp.]MDD4521634.1 RNA-guided endonuclease IscB [Methanosarcina sp.]
MIFVLNKNKQLLNPCHPAVARKLLGMGKAVIHKKYPFIIRLKELKKSESNAKFRLKIDYGSRHTGLAILNGSKVTWLAQIHHKTNIKKNMDSRRAMRRARRNRKLRYRKPRFLNRKRNDGWIPPSLQSRVDNIKNWVIRLRKLCPLTHISYENVKFDTQLMQNPEISGIEYQQGELQGYEIREYLLKKMGRKCAYCGAENVPLEVEHIIPKIRGGSSRVSNLTLACRYCNQAKGSMTAEEFGHPEVYDLVKKPLKDVAIVNATRWKIYDILVSIGLKIECGTGGRTKFNRIKLNLPKDHHFDAVCVGQSTPNEINFKTNQVLHIKAKGRGSHCRTNLNKYGFPRGYLARQKSFFGFQTGDIVKAIIPKGKYKGTHIGAISCRKTGYFDIKNKEGMKIAQGINHKYCNVLSRTDGYEYTLNGLEVDGIPLTTKVASILP